MKTILYIGALVVLAVPAFGAPITRWSGPSESACFGRCDQAWAETLLTKDELVQLRAAQKAQPEPTAISVYSGDVFNLMTYYRDDGPRGYRTTTVADLESPEIARGWEMDGWSFVKLDACQNWAILGEGNIAAGTGIPSGMGPPQNGPSGVLPDAPNVTNPVVPVAFLSALPPLVPVFTPKKETRTLSGGTEDPEFFPPLIDEPDGREISPEGEEPEPPTPVPVPPAIVFMFSLFGLAATYVFRRKAAIET